MLYFALLLCLKILTLLWSHQGVVGRASDANGVDFASFERILLCRCAGCQFRKGKSAEICVRDVGSVRGNVRKFACRMSVPLGEMCGCLLA